MSRQELAESALHRIIAESASSEQGPRLNDLVNDPSFREAFPALFEALTLEREYLESRVYSQTPKSAAEISASKRILREALANRNTEKNVGQAPVVEGEQPKQKTPTGPAAATSTRQRLLVAGLSVDGAVDPSEKVEMVLDFVQIAFSSIQHRQEVFSGELAKQIALVLPGINPVVITSELKRHEDFVRAKVLLPSDRAEQLTALYEDKANLLKHTPLLMSAELSGKTSGKVSSSVSAPDSAALLQRLDNLVRQYTETRARRDTLAMFHKTMALTDDIRKRAKQVVVVGNPQINTTVDLTGPLPFPYRGVPNVLSPRGATISPDAGNPEEPATIGNFEGGMWRPVPPPAQIVEGKRSLDETLAHFSGSAARLRLENRELGRAFKEATEVAEARRLVEAGLVNPSTLDLLLKTNEMKNEQERHMDELKLQATEEEDRRRAIELQASNDYLKRVFAVATGELEDTNANEVQRPSEVRELQKNLRLEEINARSLNQHRRKDRRQFEVRIQTADDVPATNLLGGFSDTYVRIRVLDETSERAKAEALTRTASGSAAPEWQETLTFEVSELQLTESKCVVVISLMAYNAVGTDSVIAETAVSYDVFKKRQGSYCLILPCVVLQEHKGVSLFLTTTIDNGVQETSGLALSQPVARQRYWRSQALAQSADIL